MLLNELFNTPSSFSKAIDDEDEVEYVSRLSDGSHLRIMFDKTSFDRSEFEVSFARGERSDFADARFDKTQGGNEIEVFSTVVACIRQFAQQYQPDLIMFTADKKGLDDVEDERPQSRTNLYKRLVQRSNLQNYQLQTTQYNGFDEFKFTKKQ